MRNVSRVTYRIENQIEKLAGGGKILGITLDGEKKRKFSDYLVELLMWNRRMNLISRQDTDNIALHHFLESLTLLPNVEIPNEAKMVDIGTGAGFPGIPLKICRTDLKLTLIESTRKKVLFLKHLVDHLQLSEVSVLHERAEVLHEKQEHGNNYDIAVARAVSPLRSLVLLCLPFLKPGGMFVAFKGGDTKDEMREALPQLAHVSARFEREIEIIVPLSYKRRKLFIFQRVS